MRKVSMGISYVAGLTLLAGCGASYRPVVSAISPVGPATQPQKYAVAISNPCDPLVVCNTNSLVNIVDVSGDTLLVTPSISPNPRYFAIGSNGANGYVINSNGAIDAFDISNTLMTNTVTHGSLAVGAVNSNPLLVQPSIFAGTNFIYVTENASPRQAVAAMTAATPPALQTELPVTNPIYTIGLAGSARVYTLGQGATPGTSTGTATAIEGVTNTVSNTIAVGRRPVYGVMNVDGRRAFVLNQADGTVNVINTQTNVLDTLSLIDTKTAGAQGASGVGNPNVAANPVWADTLNSINELAVANSGDGTRPGSLSIINIPLCSVATVNGNVTCDPNNPVDAVGFGNVLATVPTGVNPIMVTVLQDLRKAYVANRNDGTVSVIDMTTFTLIKTIDLKGVLAGTNGTKLNYIVATSGTPTGKVFVIADDSASMAVIYTDTDTVKTTIPLQGKGVSLRVTAP